METLSRPLVPAATELDPELVALPRPSRKERNASLALFLATALACLAMAFALWPDVRYALRTEERAIVGDLSLLELAGARSDQALSQAAGRTGEQYVEAQGTLGLAGAVRYERPFAGGSYRLMPVLGREDLWVEVFLEAGSEGGRYVPRGQFSGRLVRWSEVGLRHRGLRAAASAASGREVALDTWVLIDGETPSSARWAVGLAVLFFGFALYCLASLAVLVRRVRD